jgi:hypothetical protein
MFMVSLQILGFRLRVVSYVLDVYGFPANFRVLGLRVVSYVLDVLWFPFRF